MRKTLASAKFVKVIAYLNFVLYRMHACQKAIVKVMDPKKTCGMFLFLQLYSSYIQDCKINRLRVMGLDKHMD